jgi:chorismate mutase
MIDHVDDGLIVWLAARRKRMAEVAAIKSQTGSPRPNPASLMPTCETA